MTKADESPLLEAIKNHLADVVIDLIENGTNINATDKNGKSAWVYITGLK